MLLWTVAAAATSRMRLDTSTLSRSRIWDSEFFALPPVHAGLRPVQAGGQAALTVLADEGPMTQHRLGLLSLTPQGQGTQRQGRRLVHAAERELLAALDKHERRTLTDLLARTIPRSP